MENLQLVQSLSTGCYVWCIAGGVRYKRDLKTHDTVAAAKEEAIKQGYTIRDGEAGVFAQKGSKQ